MLSWPSSTWPSRPASEQREVGAGRDDAHRLRRVEAVGVAAHPLAFGVPVEQARAEDEVRVGRERHPRVLGERLGRVEAAHPAGSRRSAVARLNSLVRLAQLWRRSGARIVPRACSPAPQISDPCVELVARARLARRHRAEQLHRRLGRPEAVERHLLRVDVAEAHQRVAPRATRSAGSPPRSSAGRAASPCTSTCQPGWTPSDRSTSSRRVLLDARVYERAMRRSPGRPCRRARSGRRSGAP